jgi:hypothetical protein
LEVWGVRICRGPPVGSPRQSYTLEVVADTRSAGLHEGFRVYIVPRGCIPVSHDDVRVSQPPD